MCEPTVGTTFSILRGLRERYQISPKVQLMGTLRWWRAAVLSHRLYHDSLSCRTRRIVLVDEPASKCAWNSTRARGSSRDFRRGDAARDRSAEGAAQGEGQIVGAEAAGALEKELADLKEEQTRWRPLAAGERGIQQTAKASGRSASRQTGDRTCAALRRLREKRRSSSTPRTAARAANQGGRGEARGTAEERRMLKQEVDRETSPKSVSK